MGYAANVQEQYGDVVIPAARFDEFVEALKQEEAKQNSSLSWISPIESYEATSDEPVPMQVLTEYGFGCRLVTEERERDRQAKEEREEREREESEQYRHAQAADALAYVLNTLGVVDTLKLLGQLIVDRQSPKPDEPEPF